METESEKLVATTMPVEDGVVAEKRVYVSPAIEEDEVFDRFVMGCGATALPCSQSGGGTDF
jgi:hypothetical protein